MATAKNSRLLTIAAAAFLAVDAATLIVLGLWIDKPMLLMIGAGLFLSTGVVLLAWKRHQRTLDDVDAARRDVRDEARELQRLTRER